MEKVKPEKRPKTGGRKAGTPNKITGALKEAILTAAEIAGQEHHEKGEDAPEGEGLICYLTQLAKEEKKVFAGLLGRVLPYSIKPEVPPDVKMNWSFELVEAGEPDDDADESED